MLKKCISVILPLLLILATFAGCKSGSGASSGKTSKEQPYTINFVYQAPKEGNQSEVNKLINKLTMKDLNMKVNLIPVTWDTYNNKLPTMLAAGQDMDITLVLSYNFASFLDSGYIVNAAPYKQYTKNIYKLFGDEVKTGYIGDTLLGFPFMSTRTSPSAFFVRKDIFDALGYKQSDFNVSADDYSSFDQITQMLAKIKAKYPKMIPFDGHRTLGLNNISFVDDLGDYFGVLENYGQTTKVSNWYESEQFKQFAELNRKWFTNGYTSKDIAVTQDLGQAKMKAGNCAVFFATYTENAVAGVKAQTGYDTVMIPVSRKMKNTTGVNAGLNCVVQQSKNKAKAFQFLNWAYTNKDFNNYLNWGVPGRDWVVNSDGQADYPKGVTAQTVNYHADYGFCYPNQYLTTPWTGSPKNVWQLYKNFDKGAVVSKAYGFNFDASDVSAEEQQCSTVLTKYESQICFGAVDPDKAIPKFNKELYAAGLQKIMNAKQKQLNAWLAKQK